MTIFQELCRRNVFKVASVYLVTSWVILQVVSVVSPFLNLPTVFGTGVTLILLLAFPIACIFAWAFELTPEGIKRTTELIQDESTPSPINNKFTIMLTSLLVVVFAFTAYTSWLQSPVSTTINKTAEQPETPKATQTTAANTVLSIAVLPYVNMSNDAEQEYFVDGLTEETLNSLVKINGLMVMGRTSSFAYKNKNIDLRQIAKELNVNYLLEGSVRKNGERVRITAQLIEAASGAHLFSETFDRNLVDVFAIQEEISEQVASALKLTLVHKNNQYNSALKRLDYIAIEQLVVARAQLSELDERSVKKALRILEKLNQQYPNTAEIIGLLAYGNMATITSSGDSDVDIQSITGLAKKALALNPTNLDALFTRIVFESSDVSSRAKTKQLLNDMIRYHPGKVDSYNLMLSYLAETVAPCKELQDFVNSVPSGIFNDAATQAVNHRLDLCLDSKIIPHLGEPISQELQGQLDYFSMILGSFDDNTFTIMSRFVEQNPNQRNLIFLLTLQLDMGAFNAAEQTSSLLDYSSLSYGRVFATIDAYMYSQSTNDMPSEFVEFFQQAYKNSPRLDIASALVKQAMDMESFELVTDYLAGVPDFPIEVMNHKESLGLILLQYHAGKVAQSQQTAIKLLEVLNQYRQQNPESYFFYGLARMHFIAAFYGGDFEQASKVLSSGFSDNYTYWLDDIALMRIALSPWVEHPTAVEYLNRIEKDRVRARQKFNLN